MLDQRAPGALVAGFQRGDGGLLRGAVQGRRQGGAAADVKNRGRLQAEDAEDVVLQKEDLRFAEHRTVLSDRI
jgi:hypothetical protein